MIDKDKPDEAIAEINPEHPEAIAYAIAKSKGMVEEWDEAKEIFDILHGDQQIDSDMNEEGVPLDEYEAGGVWREWLAIHNVYSVRIENIGLSMPDTILTHKGLIWFNEMKVRRGSHIYAPMYQLPSYMRLGEHLRRWQIAYVVFAHGHFDVYDFGVIRSADWQPTNSGKVKLDLSGLPTIMTVGDSHQAKDYLDWVTDRAFKKKT